MVCCAASNNKSIATYSFFTEECDKFNPDKEYFVNYCKKTLPGPDNAALLWAAYQCIKASTGDPEVSAKFNLYGAFFQHWVDVSDGLWLQVQLFVLHMWAVPKGAHAIQVLLHAPFIKSLTASCSLTL